MLSIRPARWPQDVSAVLKLNTSFSTDRIYRLVRDGLSFHLVEKVVEPLVCKRYPFDPSDAEERAEWEHACIAEDEGRIVGFVAAQRVLWNRRAVIHHLYVVSDQRGRGVGTRLLNSVDAFARDAGARCLWLETQNTNYPAVLFYLHSGFALCGLDTSLYDPDGSACGEVALFLERPLLVVD